MRGAKSGYRARQETIAVIQGDDCTILMYYRGVAQEEKWGDVRSLRDVFGIEICRTGWWFDYGE